MKDLILFSIVLLISSSIIDFVVNTNGGVKQKICLYFHNRNNWRHFYVS